MAHHRTEGANAADAETMAVIDAVVGDKVGDVIAPNGIIAETVVKEAKVHKSRAQLEAEVNSARADLGTSLDELVERVHDLSPKNQAKKLRGTAAHLAKQTLADVKDFFAGEGMPADPHRAKTVGMVLKALGGVAGLLALRLLSRSIRHHHTNKAIKKAARKAVEQVDIGTVVETGPIFEIEPTVYVKEKN